MDKMTLKDLTVPLIKSIDSFNYLLKSHHRRTAILSYAIGKEMGLSNNEMTDLVLSAAMHDIGALSVQERDTLIQEDVINPNPHCMMGCKMLKSFNVFSTIAQIIKHHHIKFNEVDKYDDEILIQSHIIHLADRVDIYISPDSFILGQKKAVIQKIKEKTGTIFNPVVFEAFEKVAKSDIFWININNMSMEQVLSKVGYDFDVILSLDKVVVFAEVISKIVDYRSRYTATHSYTVGHLAYHIGKLLGLDDNMKTKLLVAGLLHDIGKIGIDPGIVEKKGKLTDEEYNQVKLHSYYSGQILQELSTNDWFNEVVSWSSHHHEKTDGSGYPFSVSGNEVDLGTRIIVYSDVMSALMEDRPYRKSLGIDVTLDILKKDLSSKVDQDIYNLILANKDQLNDVILFCQKEGLKVYTENYNC